MAVEVIDDNQEYARKLAAEYGDHCPGAALVHAFFKGDSGKNEEAMHGLDVAIERATSGQVVVIYDIMTPEQERDPRVLRLKQMQNVAFADPLLFGIAIVVAYQQAMGQRVEIDREDPNRLWNAAVPKTTKLRWARELDDVARRKSKIT